tara:strand:- start:1672 stop:1845 length:174 start_codon:yes stop_codon:yes gene_type:complete
MPKVTKTQQRRLAKEILSKSKKLWGMERTRSMEQSVMSTKDYIAVEAIIGRTLKRIG